MGDRALMQVKLNEDLSPVIYLHWDGHRAQEIIEKAAPLMRKGDLSYAFARLAGICHLETRPEQKLSFGIFNADHIITENDSHGDNGCFIIDCKTGIVTATNESVKSFKVKIND